MIRGIRWGAVAALFCAAGVVADDAALVKAEMEALKAKISAMETAQMAPAKDCAPCEASCDKLTSLKKKGCISIGGDVEMDVVVLNRDDLRSESDEVDSTTFNTSDADLNFRIDASKDTYLFIKLDLDDMWRRDGGTVRQDDILEECYFAWKNIRCSNFGMRFGKGEIAYGQDKDVVITNSYHNNITNGSWLSVSQTAANGYEANSSDTGTAANNAHDSVGNISHPGEVDNVFMVEGTYEWCKVLKLELGVYQNNINSSGFGASTRGMFEDRSDDTLFFQSGNMRLTWTPMENLKLSASAMNQHNETMGDDARLANSDEEADSSAISLAFDYTFRCIPLEIFGEYQHGSDWNWDDDYAVNTWQFGGIYGITKNIDLISVFEWMGISSDDKTGRAGRLSHREDYYKSATAAKYKFDNGISMMLEYCHEWYEQDYKAGGDHRQADAVSFRTAWSF